MAAHIGKTVTWGPLSGRLMEIRGERARVCWHYATRWEAMTWQDVSDLTVTP